MDIQQALEQFRYALFIGTPPIHFVPLTQEEYIDQYEQQLSRNPIEEKQLIKSYSIPLLPAYKKHLEKVKKMEFILMGNEEAEKMELFFTDEEALEELYDEVSNLETEEEWAHFKNIFAQK
jgi:hypothetical protein